MEEKLQQHGQPRLGASGSYPAWSSASSISSDVSLPRRTAQCSKVSPGHQPDHIELRVHGIALSRRVFQQRGMCQGGCVGMGAMCDIGLTSYQGKYQQAWFAQVCEQNDQLSLEVMRCKYQLHRFSREPHVCTAAWACSTTPSRKWPETHTPLSIYCILHRKGSVPEIEIKLSPFREISKLCHTITT